MPNTFGRRPALPGTPRHRPRILTFAPGAAAASLQVMSESPSASPPAPPRRKRRWLRRVLWALTLTLLLVWVVKVPLVNWALRRLPGDWKITVTGVHPGLGGAGLTGVRVIHRPTGRQLAHAEKAEVVNGWALLMKGELGTLTLTKAEVSWREEFETPYELPPEGGPRAVPVVAWDAGAVHDGVFTWYESGREVPRLALRISHYDGGRLTIFSDGRLEAAEQNITLSEVVSREFTGDGALEIESRSPQVEGVVTAQRALNRYTVGKMTVAAPECKVVWHRRESAPAPAPAEVSGPPRPEWDKPVEFFIKEGTAQPGKLMFTLHPAAAAAVEFTSALKSLHTKDMRIGGGQPFVIGKADATLEGIKAPGATLEAREVSFTAALDEQGRFLVASATVNGATLTDSARLLASLGLSPEANMALPVWRTGLDAKGVNLTISGGGITSPDAQQIVLENFSAVMPGGKDPVAQAVRVEVNAVLDEVFRDKRLRSVNVQKPEVKITASQFTDELIPFSTPPPVPLTAPPDKPEWYGWHTDTLTVREGKLQGRDLGPGVPDASGDFTVETTPQAPGGEDFYRIRVENITLTNPLLAALPLRTGGVMEMDVHPVRVWETESIDQVKVNGAMVELNAAFLKLFQADENKTRPATGDAPPKEPVKPATSALRRPWKIKRLVVENSAVALDDVGDGKRLVIPIREQVFENVPLGSGLMEHGTANTIQKVEVPGVFLYAPFNEGQTVVELPVNFIYFSFAGLLEKRLERVELVAPKIKAGQPLFDFIDRAKARFSAATASAPRPLLAAADKDSLPVQQALEAVRDAAARPAVWQIPFFTESGIVITAPRGVEWTQIPRLPFRNARVREGPDKGKPIPFRLHGEEVHGELAIESGWYDFPDYKVRLWMSDSGRVVFNFPLKDKDNNLVEIFENNTVIFRHLTIQKVWLSVTYDKEGIYVSLGGETCGGYITGKINLYLDQVYSWDASASFTGVNLTPLTGKLTREYVLMDGKVEVLNVVAYGDMGGLHQTTASLKMAGAGRLQIKALDNLRKKFTDNRVDWADDFGRIGVDILRDFSFTSCEGSAQLFGQEGKVKLLLKSRDGSRDFTVNLHDYRKHPEKSLIRF